MGILLTVEAYPNALANLAQGTGIDWTIGGQDYLKSGVADDYVTCATPELDAYSNILLCTDLRDVLTDQPLAISATANFFAMKATINRKATGTANVLRDQIVSICRAGAIDPASDNLSLYNPWPASETEIVYGGVVGEAGDSGWGLGNVLTGADLNLSTFGIGIAVVQVVAGAAVAAIDTVRLVIQYDVSLGAPLRHSRRGYRHPGYVR